MRLARCNSCFVVGMILENPHEAKAHIIYARVGGDSKTPGPCRVREPAERELGGGQLPYSEVWTSIFWSIESCGGVPELSSPERIATTRKPLELVWIS